MQEFFPSSPLPENLWDPNKPPVHGHWGISPLVKDAFSEV